MKIERFEDIIAWQKSSDLTVEIYKIFSQSKDFGFRDQIQRASVSAMNNIAEGFERSSDRDFRKFLYIAKGSVGEVRSMIALAQRLGYISEKQYDDLYRKSEEIAKLLSGFIKKLNV